MKNEIISSWKKNTKEWIRIIDTEQIASRQYTNKAIVNVLKETSVNKVIDIGCGEGWLTRELTAMGKKPVGIDAIEELLENARQKGSEPYYCITYEDIIEGKSVPEQPFETAIFNFCLYQKDGLEKLLKNTKAILDDEGIIIIQTLHPYFLIRNGLEYKSQIIEDSWKGLPGNFTEGHKWYARTFEDWIVVLNNSRLKIMELKEVFNNDNQPVSIILKAI